VADIPERIQKYAKCIYDMAVASHAVPPANATGSPKRGERRQGAGQRPAAKVR